jgi:hypothetical protein
MMTNQPCSSVHNNRKKIIATVRYRSKSPRNFCQFISDFLYCDWSLHVPKFGHSETVENIGFNGFSEFTLNYKSLALTVIEIDAWMFLVQKWTNIYLIRVVSTIGGQRGSMWPRGHTSCWGMCKIKTPMHARPHRDSWATFLRLSHARAKSKFLTLSNWNQPATGDNPDIKHWSSRMAGGWAWG